LRFSLAAVLPRRRDRVSFFRLSSFFKRLPKCLSSFTAWTTGVSNPVCSPRFRPSRSGHPSIRAFASGVLSDIYVFYHFTRHSRIVSGPLSLNSLNSLSFHLSFWFHEFLPSTDPLRPIFPNNTCPPRITAAAGTKLAGASCFFLLFSLKLRGFTVRWPSSPTHDHWINLSVIVQYSPLLPLLSLGLVSVLVWRYTLSGPLGIFGLVSLYLTNYLIPFSTNPIAFLNLYLSDIPSVYRVCLEILLTRTWWSFFILTIPLACVMYRASVFSEPGSNSPFVLYAMLFFRFFFFYLLSAFIDGFNRLFQ